MESNFQLGLILKRLANEDKFAFEELFNHFYPRLFYFSKSFLKLEGGIDDILQEVFLKIWQNRKNISNSEIFQAYIFTITKNHLLNELRRRLNEQKAKEKILKESVAPEFLLTEKIEFFELKEKIDHIVASLPDRQREVFRLSRHEGLSYREISEKLGISEKTVEYHISKAIAIIKRNLQELGLMAVLMGCFLM